MNVLQDTSILLADDLSDKLKLLDYEDKFCNVKDITPFPRTYFAIAAANSGCVLVRQAVWPLQRQQQRCLSYVLARSVQFQHFLDLFKFLMKMCHREFVTDKYDDPNTM